MMKKRIYIWLFFLLLIVLTYMFHWEIDCTENNAHSLSKISKKAVAALTKPVNITIYASEELPPDIRSIMEGVIVVTNDYKPYSNVPYKVNVVRVRDKKRMNEAMRAGIIPVFVETRHNNVEHLQSLFLGAEIIIGNDTTVIPSFDKYFPMEYEFTRIFLLSRKNERPHVAFITGHRESSIHKMTHLKTQLSKLYHIQEVKLDTVKDLYRYDVACILGPKESYSYYERDILNSYLAEGGKLFVALDHVMERFDYPDKNNGYINETGIEDLLEEKGLRIENDFVCDNNCGVITLKNLGNDFLGMPAKIKSPFSPLITHFANHPITSDLKSMQLSFCSSITQVKAKSTYQFIPLAKSSSISGTKKAPLFFDLKKVWHSSEFNKPSMVVSALLANEDTHSAIVVVSDSDFLWSCKEGSEHEEQCLYIDNVNFAMNAMEWLADNMGLMELRNKFMDNAPLDTTNNAQRWMIRAINIACPIIGLLSLLLWYYCRLRKKSKNRANHSYID